LISILSNTFARINEHASEEYLFQFAISTLEGVKADAVLAYQPPFNLAAYAILSVLSWILSARNLHTVNVFMIRVSSFPMLVMIGVYERYFAAGRGGPSGAGSDTATSLYSLLPRGVKNLSFVDAFVGSGSNDLLDAVLNINTDNDEFDLFGDLSEDEEEEDLYSNHRADHPIHVNDDPTPMPTIIARGRFLSSASLVPPPITPPNGRSRSRNRPASLKGLNASPLARAYSQQRPLRSPALVSPSFQRMQSDGQDVLAGLKRVEEMLRNGDGGRSDEMKEMKQRQERIEALLLTLTRGMRA